MYAALFVIAWNPFSVIDVGFWLSFSAVCILLFSSIIIQASKNKFYQVFLAQLIISIALIPITIYWFNGFSWVFFLC